ncbi:hypothetical protein TcasGA2_TC001871 [Tribolium castaneum]|uniref:Uncharacterized protein n=1 Tax=Tribolium castaneum TaxID=7070 RepID=D7EJP2_TRICA|nr:hypothetical protein TcasGA2_TC001871 [Tribolium castaneum]
MADRGFLVKTTPNRDICRPLNGKSVHKAHFSPKPNIDAYAPLSDNDKWTRFQTKTIIIAEGVSKNFRNKSVVFAMKQFHNSSGIFRVFQKVNNLMMIEDKTAKEPKSLLTGGIPFLAIYRYVFISLNRVDCGVGSGKPVQTPTVGPTGVARSPLRLGLNCPSAPLEPLREHTAEVLTRFIKPSPLQQLPRRPRKSHPAFLTWRKYCT